MATNIEDPGWFSNCNQCDQKFQSKNGLQEHLRQVHNVRRFSAKWDKGAVIAGAAVPMVLKQPTNTDPNWFTNCNQCDEKFGNKTALQQHLREDHNITRFSARWDSDAPLIQPTDAADPDYYTNCHQCDKKFSSKNALQEHLRTEHNVARFSARWDKDAVIAGAAVPMFLKQPTSTDPAWYTNCNQCDRKFGNKTALQEHLRTDHNITRFSGRWDSDAPLIKSTSAADPEYYSNCNQCGQKFGDKNVLKEHLREVHNITRFSAGWDPDGVARVPKPRQPRDPTWFTICRQCGAGFHDKNVLRHHLALTHGIAVAWDDSRQGQSPRAMRDETRFTTCGQCGVVFMDKNLLKHHLQSTHGIAVAWGSDRAAGPRTIQDPTWFTTCRQCNAQFHEKGLLKYHLQAVHNIAVTTF